MPRVSFTQNIQRHVECPTTLVPGRTVRALLDAVFTANPRARGYVLDEQGALRHHMNVFINGQRIRDRCGLSDEVAETDDVYIFQALSGG